MIAKDEILDAANHVIVEKDARIAELEAGIASLREILKIAKRVEIRHEGAEHDDTTNDKCRACEFNDAISARFDCEK